MSTECDDTLKSKFYDSSLKLLSSRRHSLIAEKPNLRDEIVLTDDINLDAVKKTVDLTRNHISHLVTVRKSFDVILNNLDYIKSKDTDEVKLLLIEINSLCMQILSLKLDKDNDIYDAKLKHGKSLERYDSYLRRLLQTSTYQKTPDPNFVKKLESTERLLQKLNAARIIKNHFMAAFQFDPSNRQNFRTLCRKQFKLEDFLK